MAKFTIDGSINKDDLLSALKEMKAEAEATEREIWNNMSEELKEYMFKVAEMSTENQKKVFEFIDSVV